MSNKQKHKEETLDTQIDAEQEKQKTEIETEQDARTIEFQKRLADIKTNISQKNFEKLITLDEFTVKDKTYKAVMLNHKKTKELEVLQAEASQLADKDDEAYYDNIRKRACILIEDMTPEQFDEAPYYVMENLVAAWGLKDRGFRDLFQGS